MENENKELSEREIRQTIMASAVGAAFIGGSATLVFPFLPLYLMELGLLRKRWLCGIRL